MSFDISYALELFGKSFLAARITFLITFVSMLFGIVIALAVAMVNYKHMRLLSAISKVYISFIRGTPMMIQIYLIYYLIPRLVNHFVEAWQLDFDIYAVNTMVYAYIVFSLHAGATLGEVFRGALSTVEVGQVEAAYAIGMTGWQTFLRVIFPQSVVVAIPNICTNFINILKATSLVFSMAILDITGVAKVAANESYKFLEAYLAILLVYVIICYITERIFKRVEKAIGKYRLAS